MYAFGRLLIFMAFEWESAFTLLYEPIPRNQFDLNKKSLPKLRKILSTFLEPQPTKRIVLYNVVFALSSAIYNLKAIS